jgi:hypothetical protein
MRGLVGQPAQAQRQRAGAQEVRGLAQAFGIALAVGALDQAHLLGRVGDEQADQLLHQPGPLALEGAQLVQGLQVDRPLMLTDSPFRTKPTRFSFGRERRSPSNGSARRGLSCAPRIQDPPPWPSTSFPPDATAQ